MKKLFKLLILPVAFNFCSMAKTEDPVIVFEAFSIYNENRETRKLSLLAYVDILVDKPTKVCSYTYSWIDETGESHPCGGSSIIGVTIYDDYPLYGCWEIEMDELDEHSLVTFFCEAKIRDVGNYQISMPYCSKVEKDFTINENLNGKELTTGYIKQSTFPNHNLDYYYEDVFSFLNFEDLRVNELYYDIDLSYLRFKYRDGLDNILKGDFKFAFYDRYNLFPDFEVSEESLYRYIPLTFNREGDECYFTFTPTIYYDPVTHNSSLKKKDGYLPYHHLMLPFSAYNELKFLPCYLELKVQSHTEFTIRGDFTMTYIKKYIGDKEDSKFHEDIHQDDEVNVRERTIEVTI